MNIVDVEKFDYKTLETLSDYLAESVNFCRESAGFNWLVASRSIKLPFDVEPRDSIILRDIPDYKLQNPAGFTIQFNKHPNREYKKGETVVILSDSIIGLDHLLNPQEKIEGISQDCFVGNFFDSVEDVWFEIKKRGQGWPGIKHYQDTANPLCIKGFARVSEVGFHIPSKDSIKHFPPESGLMASCQGLFVFGDSYLGKTTSVAALYNNYISMAAYHCANLGKFKPDCVPVFMEAHEFADLAKSKARVSQTKDWLNSLCQTDLLVLDDIDKFQISESVEVALFGLIKMRIERKKFTVITSNQAVDTLVNRFDLDRREALLNRFKVHYMPVRFTRDKEASL